MQVPATGTVEDINEKFYKEIPELTAHRTLNPRLNKQLIIFKRTSLCYGYLRNRVKCTFHIVS